MLSHRSSAPPLWQRPGSSGAIVGRRVVIFAAGGTLAVVLVAAAVVLLPRSTSPTSKVAKAMRTAGCTFANFPEQESLPDYATLPPEEPVPYNSSPPTSGRHFLTTVVWGIYGQPVSEYQVVTNLARGGIVIQWGMDVPAAEVRRAQAFITRDGTAMIGAPNALLGDKIALTAWTRLAECTRWNLAAAKLFRDTFRFNGPDSPGLDPASLAPGK